MDEVKEEQKQEETIKQELPKKKEKKKEVCKHQEEIDKLKNELALKDEKLLRISAEMQNMKRRSEEERAKLIKYDGEELITSILPILDNFEHAVKMDDSNLDDEVSKFLSGFKMIYGNFVDILKKHEVQEIDCLHQEFDDNQMHAVLVDQDENFANNIVLDVMQKGYMYKDKVIRPAMVKVNSRESNG